MHWDILGNFLIFNGVAPSIKNTYFERCARFLKYFPCNAYYKGKNPTYIKKI